MAVKITFFFLLKKPKKVNITYISKSRAAKRGFFYIQIYTLLDNFSPGMPRCRSPPIFNLFPRNKQIGGKGLKKYKDSDYALNKFSAGIVYRFADNIVEISLADYLAENPGKTKQDFQELKALSDAIYLNQVRAENRQTKKDVSIHGMEESRDLGSVPLEEEYIEAIDRKKAIDAYSLLMGSGLLTETQERRLILRIRDGLSQREIAVREGVTYHAVALSLKYATEKLKKIL